MTVEDGLQEENRMDYIASFNIPKEVPFRKPKDIKSKNSKKAKKGIFSSKHVAELGL